MRKLLAGSLSCLAMLVGGVAEGSGHRDGRDLFIEPFSDMIVFDPGQPSEFNRGISLDLLDGPGPVGPGVHAFGGVDFFPIGGDLPFEGRFDQVPNGSSHPDSFFDIFLDLGENPGPGDVPDRVGVELVVFFFDLSFVPGTVIDDAGGTSADSFFDVFFEVDIVGEEDPPIFFEARGETNSSVPIEIVSMDLRSVEPGLGPDEAILRLEFDTSDMSPTDFEERVLRVHLDGVALPEPSAMGLLLVGGMLLGRRRVG